LEESLHGRLKTNREMLFGQVSPILAARHSYYIEPP
jgi:hypothetical protein